MVSRILSICLAGAFVSACAVKPTPLAQSEVKTFAVNLQSSVAMPMEPVQGGIDLYEAIARAVKHNRDKYVEEASILSAQAEMRVQNAEMLPQLVSTGSYYTRNPRAASTSASALTGQTSSTYSISSDQSNVSGDITFGWNILDFGLSYVRAKQAGDKMLYAEEQRRKVTIKIIEDTRAAFFRAIALERLVSRLRDLEEETQRSLRESRALANTGLAQPLPALSYERDLLSVKRDLENLEAQLAAARLQLASLMNIPMGQKFHLVAPNQKSITPILRWSPEKMVELALSSRPEVRQLMLESRINQKEVVAAVLELLPSLNPYASLSADSSSFLMHSNWVAMGARASWNLMKIFQFPIKNNAIKAKEEVVREKALALAVAITTQVYIGRARFAVAMKQYQTAADSARVQDKILHQLRAEALAGRSPTQSVVREKLSSLLAQGRQDVAFADLQAAFGSVVSAIGVDVIDNNIAMQMPVKAVAQQLSHSIGKYDQRINTLN